MTNKFKFLLASALLLIPNAALAGTVKGTAPTGYSTIAISGGSSDTATAKRFTLTTGSSDVRLYLEKDGQIAAPIVLGVKNGAKYYSLTAARAAGICRKSSARLVMGAKPGTKTLTLSTIKIVANAGIAYTTAAPAKAKLSTSSLATISNKSKCYPSGTGGSLGLVSASARALGRQVVIKAESTDADSDGLVNQLDADDDNDGTLDSYDSSSPSEAAPATGISAARIFSNLKLPVESSLNLYTDADSTLSTAELDAVAPAITLAMQVAGGNTLATELNCNGLTYCSTGGTGQYNNQPFPASYDTDADGFGLMTVGVTGDFQLQTLVTSNASINGGDLFTEIVTNTDASETEVPGILNFVFRTTPAIKSVTMNSTETTFTYPGTSGMPGTANNPVTAPVGWDGNITFSVYRPQREGVSAVGEGALVDMGNSIVLVDIPNAACATSSPGGCPGSGPRCALSHYSESDTNIELAGEAVQDIRGDVDSDATNASAALMTFTLNLDQCLADSSQSPTSGQKIKLDIQFKSADGDNAAQAFYLARP